MDLTRTTTRDIRRQNRSILLSRLFFDGPLSRLELGQITGLSSATVSTVTAELIDDGLVVEAGLVDSGGGRPRVLLRVDPGHGYLVGVDVGETGVTVELFDLAMRQVARVVRPVASHRPDPATVVTEMAAGISDVLAGSASAAATSADNRAAGDSDDGRDRDGARASNTDGDTDDDHAGDTDDDHTGDGDGAAPIDPSLVIGIGIGVPGIVEQRPTPTVYAPTIGWSSVRLAEMLAAHGIAAPVFVGNGAKTQAQAEMWFGAARGARQAVVALVGSGVGAAVIADGEPFGGATGSAGEWGHTTLVYDGRQCRCGARGCLEAYVGAEGILDRYGGRSGGASTLPDGDPLRADGDEVAAITALITAARESPSGGAAELVAETAAYLGTGIGNLINLFNPERVVLGGWAGLALGSVALEQIRAATARQALAQPYAQVTIELSQLGTDAVALGAATLPLAELLRRGDDIRGQ